MTMNKKKVLAVSLGVLMAVSATAGFAAQNFGGQRGGGRGMMNGQGCMGQGCMARPSAQAPLTREAYEEMLNKFVTEKKIDEAGKAALMKRYDAAKEFFAANEAAREAREKLCVAPQGPRGPMNGRRFRGQGQGMMNGRHHGFHMQGHQRGMRDGRGMNAAQNPQAQAFCLRNQDGTIMDRDAYGAKLDGLVESKTLSAQGKEILMKRFDAVKAYVEGAGAAGLPMRRGCFR